MYRIHPNSAVKVLCRFGAQYYRLAIYQVLTSIIDLRSLQYLLLELP